MIDHIIHQLSELKQKLEKQEKKPKVVITTMLQYLHLNERRLVVDMFNTQDIDLQHLQEIIKRECVTRDNFANLSYPPRIRITIERIDDEDL